jgi:hypothetical protein
MVAGGHAVMRYALSFVQEPVICSSVPDREGEPAQDVRGGAARLHPTRFQKPGAFFGLHAHPGHEQIRFH